MLLLIRDRSPFTAVMVVVLIGLVYDNVMIPLGTTIGDGNVLESLSRPRFYVHGTLTPTLMLFAAATARDMGVPWARRRPGWIAVGVITALMVVRGFTTDVLNLEIESSTKGGLLHFTYVHPAESILPSVVTVVVLIVIGVTMLRSASWPWLLAGAVFMFLASGGGSAVPYLANLGETGLTISLLATGWHAWTVRSAEGARAPATAARA